MDTSKSKRRKAVRRCFWVIVAAIILLASLPAWFPWVLKPLLNHYGLGFASYERLGCTQFALGGVTGKWKGTRLEAKRVECVLPMTWIWRKLANGTSDSPYLSVKDGDMTIIRSGAETQGTDEAIKKSSADETLNQAVRFGRMLERLVPVAALTDCTIQIASNHVLIPHADWRGGRLEASVKPAAARGEVELAASIRGSSSLQVHTRWDAYDSSLRGEFSRTAAGWQWKGEAVWRANQGDLSAQFATHGWWPVKAQLNCPALNVPASLVHLSAYQDLNAALAVNLSSNQFSLQATGFARPSADFAARGFTASDFSLAAEGNPDSVHLRKFDIRSPWLNVELTSPAGLTWQGELLANPAQLQVAVDLGKLSNTSLRGQAYAQVHVAPHGRQPPTARFSCSATNIRAWRVDAETIQARGEFASPNIRLEELAADFMDGSKLAASGSFDSKTQQIVKGDWKFSGSYLNTFLPGVGYDRLTGSGEFRGPLTNVSHSGKVAIKGLYGFGLKPLNADAKWSGQSLMFDFLDLHCTRAKSTLSIGGAVDLSALKAGKTSTTLTNVSLRRNEEELYALQSPCAILFQSGGTNSAPRNWTLAVDAFDWRGADRAVSLAADVSWPARGDVAVAMTNFAPGVFADFLTNAVPHLSLAALDVAVRWSNGPVHSAISIVGAMTNRTSEIFVLNGALATDETLSINQLFIEYAYTPALSVTGSVPVRIVPGRAEGWLVWDESRTIALTGNWADGRAQQFSLPLASRGELEISEPELLIQVSGTPGQPSASLQVGAASIGWRSPTNVSLRPRLEDMHLSAQIQPDRIALDAFRAKLDGQTIEATGEWPLPDGTWTRLWTERKPPDWSQAHGLLELENAQMAAVARYLPQVLAPEGQVNAKFELKSGKQLEGRLSLTNAATRSLGKVAPLRDISAQVQFDGHRAVLRTFGGQIGGQPVRADGFVSLADGEGLDYQLNVSGTNVPLARSPELLLRGDFDIRLRGGSNSPPVLSGGLKLHDGLYLQHASALVWSRPKRSELRPPYFSVTNKPVADWKLDFTIAGDRFLRTRTPVFNGLLSADLKLKGSLRQPVLTGDVRVDSGRVIFPFGTLDVDQGHASFTGNDPRGPDLQLNASGRNYRYDLRLEAKGPANVADVTFSSTPPLTSEQILLMLTAGELPQTDFAYSSGARVGRLATFLGKDLFSRFLGTGRGDERLIIRTGESISEEGRLTYSVEYRLTDRWSIIGEYDEYNAFNTDLKWKIFTR